MNTIKVGDLVIDIVEDFGNKKLVITKGNAVINHTLKYKLKEILNIEAVYGTANYFGIKLKLKGGHSFVIRANRTATEKELITSVKKLYNSIFDKGRT